MATRHNWRTTRTELEFSVNRFIFIYVSKIFFLALLRGAITLPHEPTTDCSRALMFSELTEH